MDNKIINQLNLNLSDEDFENMVKRLCFFAPKGSGSYIRDLHDFITMQALSVMPSGQLSIREIYSIIRKSFGTRFEYEEILDALRRLSSSGQIRSIAVRFEDPENRFEIMLDKRNELRNLVKKEESLESQVLTEWKNSLQTKYPNITSTILTQMTVDIKVCAYRLLSKHSIEALELYYGNNEKINSILENVNSLSYLDKTNNIPKEFEQVRFKEVFDFFLRASDLRKQYIASIMHSLFILFLTQVDPKCAAVLSNEIKSAKIYLDTNFVFALVGLSGGDMLLASQRLIDFTHRLGFEIVISPRTKSEYEHTLKNFLNDTKNQPLPSSELASLALRATSDEDIYTNYWKQAAESKGVYVDPQNYYDYYINVEAILINYGIRTDDTFNLEITASDSEISAEASRLREVIRDAFGQQAVDTTSQHVLDHDAYHRLLILKYREGNQKICFLDAKAWFLTLDSKLPRYDRVSRGKDQSSLPFCVLSGQWLQLIRPYLGLDGEIDLAQAQMLVTPLIRAYPKPPTKLINSVISTLAMSKILVPNAAAQMLSDRHFLEKFQDAETDEVRQDLIDSFYAAYAEETEHQLNERKKQVEEMQNVINNIIVEKNGLAEALSQQTKENTNISNLLHEQQEKIQEIQKNFELARQEDSEKAQNELLKIKSDISNINAQNNQSSTKSEKEKLLLKRIIIFLILMIYLGLRQPWNNSPNPIGEIITSILITTSIGTYLQRKTRVTAILLLFTTILFGIWLIGNQKIIDAVLYISTTLGGLGNIYPFLESRINHKNDILA